MVDELPEEELPKARQVLEEIHGSGTSSEPDSEQAIRLAAIRRIGQRRKEGPTFSAEQIDAWVDASRP